MRSSIIDTAALLNGDAEISDRNHAAKERLEEFRVVYLQSTPPGNFDHELWRGVTIESATVDPEIKTGTAIYSLTAPDKYCNFTHNMMGGAIATILDGLTNCTIALVSRKGFWEYSGVSRSTNLTYINPVAIHAKLLVECTILRVNSTSITIQGTMRCVDENKILALCIQEFVAIGKPKM